MGTGLADVLRWLTNAAFVALALVGLREWRRHRRPAALWMSAAFGVLGVVVLASLALPEDPEGFTEEGLQRLLVATLLLMPYLLFRFTVALNPAGRAQEWAVAAAALGPVAVTLALPEFPGPNDTEPGWWSAYLVAALGSWSAVSALVAWRLWQAGRPEPRLARRRMHFLAGASVAFALTLIGSATAGSDDDSDVAANLVQLGALASASLFYVGYAPPLLVRLWWRRQEQDRLRQRELQLLASEQSAEITKGLLRGSANSVGARGAALVDHDGNLVDVYGEIGDRLTGGAPDPRTETMVVPLRMGKLVLVTSQAAPLFGRDELTFVQGLGVIADLALERAALLEREQRARADLERSNEELEQFASIASHDLKQPLTAIGTYAELLQRRHGEALGEQGLHHLDQIVHSAERLHSLINDLLELSRVTSQARPLECTDVEATVRESLDHLQPSITERGAVVRVGDLPEALADRNLLRQAFQNLIGNAVKYGGEPPLIDVRGRVDGSWCVYEVSDNGTGISPADRQRIFLPFQRAHGPEGPEGTGIGLAIVKKVVDLHGGRVWVESEAGKGTTFRFTLLPAG